ncbi:MAG: hypothetical protein HKP55_08190 [Gammaproteobacteria bacterium]|nr:hypothetical protein [Gammaproteobacteria bacterium]
MGVAVIRELYGVMTDVVAQYGKFVCSSQFSRDAKQFAQGKPIELVDVYKLVKLINAVQKEKRMQTIYPPLEPKPSAASVMATPQTMTPDCPRCGSGMVKGKAKHGKNIGKWFWGCSQFPDCKGMQPIE